MYVSVKGWMRCAVEGFTVHLLFLIVDDILSRFHSETCFMGAIEKRPIGFCVILCCGVTEHLVFTV
jgi:hypothetical protein